MTQMHWVLQMITYMCHNWTLLRLLQMIHHWLQSMLLLGASWIVLFVVLMYKTHGFLRTGISQRKRHVCVGGGSREWTFQKKCSCCCKHLAKSNTCQFCCCCLFGAFFCELLNCFLAKPNIVLLIWRPLFTGEIFKHNSQFIGDI